ncbi:hypothetical protein [Sorangium sp. So ce1078]|uniref:hypothetical protein n=1 Tax=Sorangium sp. So ce1078 TaxID=3133329 RepID=UPI003F60D23B
MPRSPWDVNAGAIPSSSMLASTPARAPLASHGSSAGDEMRGAAPLRRSVCERGAAEVSRLVFAVLLPGGDDPLAEGRLAPEAHV